jgi:hypothetical protein
MLNLTAGAAGAGVTVISCAPAIQVAHHRTAVKKILFMIYRVTLFSFAPGQNEGFGVTGFGKTGRSG